MSPVVSVIIPTKNRRQTLSRALASVRAQDLGDAIEVIIANDGGEPVDDVVDEFRDLTVTLISNDVSNGCAAARNAALDTASGRYVACLDDDDILLPGHLSAAVAALDSHDLVYAPAVVRSEGDPPTEDRLGQPFDLDFLHVQNYIPLSGVVFRATPASRFDVHLELLEDWDMWLRLALAHNYRIGYLPRPGAVYHRPAATTPTPNATAILRRFRDYYVMLCERWAVPAGSRIAAYRKHLLDAYRIAFARHADGKPLHTFWYDRVVALLYQGFTSAEEPADLPGRLAVAVGG